MLYPLLNFMGQPRSPRSNWWIFSSSISISMAAIVVLSGLVSRSTNNPAERGGFFYVAYSITQLIGHNPRPSANIWTRVPAPGISAVMNPRSRIGCSDENTLWYGISTGLCRYVGGSFPAVVEQQPSRRSDRSTQNQAADVRPCELQPATKTSSLQDIARKARKNHIIGSTLFSF